MVNYVWEGWMDITILPWQTLDDAMKISETNPITEANVEKADFGNLATVEEIDAILSLSEEISDDFENITLTQEDLANAFAQPNFTQEDADNLLK